MTTLSMHRITLITSKREKEFHMGIRYRYEKNSANEDLETFFKNVRHGNKLDSNIHTYFLPKLTEEEMELIEKKDPKYLTTLRSPYPIKQVSVVDVPTKNATPEYVECLCYRSTVAIENKSS